MSLRDKVKQNLKNAEKKAANKREVSLRQTVDEVCSAVRDRILACSEGHTDSRTPFKVEMCLVCESGCLEKKEGPWVKGFFQQSTQINTITIKPEVARQIALIKKELESDGIRVTDLRYSGDYNLDYDCNITPKNRVCHPFALYRVELSGIRRTQILLDPMKPITEKVVQDKSFGIRYNTTFSQGKLKYSGQELRDQVLCMHITYTL